MKFLALAATLLVTSSFSPATAQDFQQMQACVLGVVNVTDDLVMQVHLSHGDVVKVYPEYVYPNDVWSTRVPCGSDVPVTILLRNVNVPEDFVVRDLMVPPPGSVRMWCIGPTERCEELAKRGNAKTEPITIIGGFQA
jgi:hypothetical protein